MKRRVGRGNATIDGAVQKYLSNLFGGDVVVFRRAQMETQLLTAIERNH